VSEDIGTRDGDIRDGTGADLHRMGELNEAAIPHVSSIDVAHREWFLRHSAHFLVVDAGADADAGADMAAFLLAFEPGADYQSPNFQWFKSRYRQFSYVDRIVVAPAFRGRKLAQRLYAELQRRVQSHCTAIACEVNLEPPNPASLAFHRRRGFEPVGTQRTEGGTKQVQMLLKNLAQTGNGP